MRAIVLAGGDPPARAALDSAWPGWDVPCGLVVAADRGALAAPALGLRLDTVVGDADSLDPRDASRLAAAGVPFERVPVEKDETDTELAVLVALARGATEIVLLGALGGPRIDHAIANIALLGHAALRGLPVAILDGRTRIRLLVASAGKTASLDLDGRAGDTVSLVPLGIDAEGITTHGLAYGLAGATLPAGPARGVSNVRTVPHARVELGSGRLLVIEIADGPAPAEPGTKGGLP